MTDDIIQAMVDIDIKLVEAMEFDRKFDSNAISERLEYMKAHKPEVKKPGAFLRWSLARTGDDWKILHKSRLDAEIKKIGIVRLFSYGYYTDKETGMNFLSETGNLITNGTGEKNDLFYKTRFIDIYIPFSSVSLIEDVLRPRPETSFSARSTDERVIKPYPVAVAYFENGELKEIREIESSLKTPF